MFLVGEIVDGGVVGLPDWASAWHGRALEVIILELVGVGHHRVDDFTWLCGRPLAPGLVGVSTGSPSRRVACHDCWCAGGDSGGLVQVVELPLRTRGGALVGRRTLLASA